MIRCNFLAVVFLAAIPALAQPCEAPSGVKSAIDAAMVRGRPTGERIEAARKVRDEFPSEYFAHRFYQELFVTQGLFSKEIQEEYRALADAHPDDVLYVLLYARTLKGTNTPEAIKLLDQVLSRDPDNAQAHLKLTEIYAAPAFRDPEKLRMNVESFRRSCPSSLAGYSPQLATVIEDQEFLERSAANLRKLIEERDDDEALRNYNTLWSMEFKSVPLSAQEPVRERIRGDVAKLRGADWSKNSYVLTELAQAYKMLGDSEGSKWVERHTPKNDSNRASAVSEAINDWRHANPYQTGWQREAFQETMLKQTEEWIRRWPDEPQPYHERFNAMRMSSDTPIEDTIKVAQDWIRVYEQRPRQPEAAYLAPYMPVAQFYSQHNMRYGELPDLLEKGLKLSPIRESGPVSDLFRPSSQARMSMNYSSWSALNSAASIYLKIRKFDQAKEALAKLGPSLLKEKPADTASEGEKRSYGMIETQYWSSMARIARAEGRKPDVMTYERNSLWADPNISSNPSMEKYRTNSLRDLWKELNGSDKGFEAWLAKPGPGTPRTATSTTQAPAVAATEGLWTKLQKPLPDFAISDADGKTWRLADLKGKVTLVNLWATWCGPCRTELPYLQKVFNKVRERKDLVVITLNTDDNPGLIEPFLKDNKYTFPVLPASNYVNKLLPELSIPRNWIVDAGGVLRMERIGFGTGDDRWVEDMIAAMEKLRE